MQSVVCCDCSRGTPGFMRPPALGCRSLCQSKDTRQTKVFAGIPDCKAQSSHLPWDLSMGEPAPSLFFISEVGTMFTLNVKTDQEAFDKVARHLSNMKKPSNSSVRGVCLYAGPNETRCAASALIDATYEEVAFLDGRGDISVLIHQGAVEYIETDQ